MTYTVISHNSMIYKVSLEYTLNQSPKPVTMWVADNGTVLALYVKGVNYTGSAASSMVLGYFSDLDTLNTIGLQESTVTSYFHAAGNSTVSIGTNSFAVTDYVANATPETVQVCGLGTAVVNTYSVYLGTPEGSSLELIAYANFSVSLATESGTTTLDYTYQLTGLTLA